MNLEDVIDALDPIKERISSLEQNNYKEAVAECQKTLRLALDAQKRAEQLMQRVREAESRIEAHALEIKVTHIKIANTLAGWADYFKLRPTLNLRIDRTEKCTLGSELDEIVGDMENTSL